MRLPTLKLLSQVSFVAVFVVSMSIWARAQGPMPTPTPTPCNHPVSPGNAPCVYLFKQIYSGGGTNHEPPIGVSGDTVVFDLPCSRTLRETEENDGYHLYNIQPHECEEEHQQRIQFEKYKAEYEAYKDSYLKSAVDKRDDSVYQTRTREYEEYKAEVTLPYTAIRSVLVMTEDANTGEGRVSLIEYHLRADQNVRLKLWMAKKSQPDTYSNSPDMEIQGSGGGTIRSRREFKGKDPVKAYRTGRYRVSNDRKIVKWQIVDYNNQILFSSQGDDQYQLYIRFYHPGAAR